jgi:Holliday junction resolvasome RuvABC endonuclease subunit
MINDMDTQEIYGIMSMEEIEQMFSQIERRIGVHEHKVSAIEQRWMAFNEWWIMKQVEAPGIVIEQTGGEDER